MIQLLLAIFQAIPAAKALFDELVAEYIRLKIGEMKKENREAIKKAFAEFDQRALEEALGNPEPGLPSRNVDSVIHDSLPGLPKSRRGPG